ncbi:hypothetical protein YA0745_31185, partial [Pseudomonas synxantha]|nr:hypothetical protein [Pseudomonas synxantha]
VTGSTVDKKLSATFLTKTVEKGERYIHELSMREVGNTFNSIVMNSKGNLSTFEDLTGKASKDLSIDISISQDSKNIVGEKAKDGNLHKVSLELNGINGGKILSKMHKLEKNEQDDHTVREAVKRGYKP